jgi:hypothetical protein
MRVGRRNDIIDVYINQKFLLTRCKLPLSVCTAPSHPSIYLTLPSIALNELGAMEKNKIPCDEFGAKIILIEILWIRNFNFLARIFPKIKCARVKIFKVQRAAVVLRKGEREKKKLANKLLQFFISLTDIHPRRFTFSSSMFFVLSIFTIQ